MKNKKIFCLLILVLIIILVSLFFIIKNFTKNNSNKEQNQYLDYTPEEEISNKQMRETNITLYFIDNENKIQTEKRLIDSAELLQDPYQKLISLLISGPESENLSNVFPENTKILDTKLENNCAILNFSKEIQNYNDDTQKYNIINTILNTLTQLNEVNSIKILINNETVDKFNDEYSLSH